MAKHEFITGSNGFLGRNILEYLLKNTNSNFYLLVRSDNSKNAILEYLKGTFSERINFVKGDLTLPDFGLNDVDRERVISCENFWHFAAATTFDDRKKDSITATNIGGATNIINLAKEATNIRHLYYISTAYIAGKNKGVIYEDIMPPNKGFKNSYEESKYNSEKLVRETTLPWTIFRPSIVVGNSKTFSCQGEVRMIYGYVLGIYTALLAYFRNHEDFVKTWKNKEYPYINLRMKGHPDTSKNFICIDAVVGMISDIIASDCIQKTFHLTTNHLAGKDISEALNNAFRIKGLNYVTQDISSPNNMERLAHKLTAAFDDYCYFDDPEWDTTNTDNALKKHKKIKMTNELFQNLIESFIKSEIIDGQSSKYTKT